MRKFRPKYSATHVLVVLGSGGHTAEMFSMLRRAKFDPSIYTYRTYVVSSGDHFSAVKAREFENGLLSKTKHNEGNGKQHQGTAKEEEKEEEDEPGNSYTIVTVPRARRIHQSYLTAPFSTLQCFWACLLVLLRLHPDQRQSQPSDRVPSYPDIILSNGPATAVCVIMAAKLIRLFRLAIGNGVATPHQFQLRTVFVESWARVSTLSLSGKLLLPFVDRFLVQWSNLAGKRAWKGTKKTEYIGVLVE